MAVSWLRQKVQLWSWPSYSPVLMNKVALGQISPHVPRLYSLYPHLCFILIFTLVITLSEEKAAYIGSIGQTSHFTLHLVFNGSIGKLSRI